MYFHIQSCIHTYVYTCVVNETINSPTAGKGECHDNDGSGGFLFTQRLLDIAEGINQGCIRQNVFVVFSQLLVGCVHSNRVPCPQGHTQYRDM